MAGPAHVRLLVFADLVLDGDILLPIVEDAAAWQIEPTLLATRRFVDQAGRRAREIMAAAPALVLGHRRIRYLAQPGLTGFDAVLTASESSAPAHRTAHVLTRRANARKLCTFTVQHGLENVGLTYLDREHGADTTIAAQRIYAWGPPSALHPAFAGRIGPRVLGVGCPKPAGRRDAGAPARMGRVLICENLHWRRYDDAYRRQFLEDLGSAARSLPGIRFLVKPHPAGRWLQGGDRDWPANIECIGDPHPLAEASVQQLFSKVDAVLTTPSTIALDAARAGCPVAVLGYNLDLPAFAPLPIIRSRSDWSSLLQQSGGLADRDGRASVQQFLDRNCLPGDAVPRILADILQSVAGRRAQA